MSASRSGSPREEVAGQRSLPRIRRGRIDTVIVADVGPEVIAGSTRMKSMLAQLMIVHMMSTAAMVRLGKTYGNIMVDVCAVTENNGFLMGALGE